MVTARFIIVVACAPRSRSFDLARHAKRKLSFCLRIFIAFLSYLLKCHLGCEGNAFFLFFICYEALGNGASRIGAERRGRSNMNSWILEFLSLCDYSIFIFISILACHLLLSELENFGFFSFSFFSFLADSMACALLNGGPLEKTGDENCINRSYIGIYRR